MSIGCEKGESITASPPDGPEATGAYLAPGEWRQPFTLDDVKDFSATYGAAATPLSSRSGETLHGGYAVELMEAAVNYDHRRTEVELYDQQSTEFSITVPASESWSATDVSALYAAVDDELEASAGAEREVSSVNLTGPLDGPDGPVMNGTVETHTAFNGGGLGGGIFPRFYGWNDSPWVGCSDGSLIATPRVAENFDIARAAATRAVVGNKGRSHFVFDIVGTRTQLLNPTGRPTPTSTPSGTLLFKILDFPTGSTNLNVRGPWKTYLSSGYDDNCIPEEVVDNYGKDHFSMGAEMGFIFYGVPPGNINSPNDPDTGIGYVAYDVTRRRHAFGMTPEGNRREWITILSVGKLMVL